MSDLSRALDAAVEERYLPKTLEEALEVIKDLQYELEMAEESAADWRQEARNYENDLYAAHELIVDLEREIEEGGLE